MTTVNIRRRDSADPLEVIDPLGKADSTAGVNAFLNEQPDGTTVVNPFFYDWQKIRCEGDIEVRPSITITSPAPFKVWPKFVKTVSLPWRVSGRTPACAWQYDALGGQAMEPYSFKNPYGVIAVDGDWRPISHGSENGGYSGTTGANGVDYDGLHLTDRYSAPFTRAVIGKRLVYIVPPGQEVFKTITDVSADGHTAYFTNTDGSSIHENSSHTVAWAIVEPNDTWYATFVPNPAWQKIPYTNGYHGFKDCLYKVQNRNQLPLFNLHGDAKIESLELGCPNTAWRNSILKWENSEPAAVEYQRAVLADSPDAQIVGCKIHHTWGAGEGGSGQVIACEIHDVGMQCGTLASDDKIVVWNRLYRSHRSCYSVENADPTNVRMDYNMIGGPHGVSVSSTIRTFSFSGNRSTAADVAAGRIPSVTHLQSGSWGDSDGKQSSDWQIANNVQEDPAHLSDPVWTIHDVDGATVTGNKGNTKGYFLTAKNCTAVVTNPPNNGGPACKGQVTP